MTKAREKQRDQYNKRSYDHRFLVGDKVLLDTRIVQEGEARKFVSKYKGIYRVIRVYPNFTCDIADETFRPQRVHFNRLRLVTERMIWQDQEMPVYDPTSRVLEHYRKNETTQTTTLVTSETPDEIDKIPPK
jgi:hypothetical protein